MDQSGTYRKTPNRTAMGIRARSGPRSTEHPTRIDTDRFVTRCSVRHKTKGIVNCKSDSKFSFVL